MNFARKICIIRNQSLTTTFSRKFRFSAKNLESSQASQPQVQEEKFAFEDLNVLERTERRKPKIQPFMKNVFVSIFNKELLAYPEILNKEESENLDARVAALENFFDDASKTKEDRKTALKRLKMYAAPVSLTNNGLAMNYTESLRYLEVIAHDMELGQEVSDHWVCLEALRKGLESEQYQQIVDDLTSGDKLLRLCIKEKVAERVTQADFRTHAELDGQGIWRIAGEKYCNTSDKNSYFLVLCTVDAGRVKAFLVHPNAGGVEHNGSFITFRQTPATPLSVISEEDLAHILGTARLYAATLCRVALSRAMKSCVDYIRPRVFSGKPLSELSTIRSTIGEATVDIYASESAEYFTAGLLDGYESPDCELEVAMCRSTIGEATLAIYASESAEYFTAGLLDGYESPDCELEVAMCRNFIANHGLTTMLKLISIPALEQEEECRQLFDEMRHLAARGESLGSINMFIALNGIHHAGKNMAEEIKQIRNPLFHPAFILRKVIENRHQEKDEPKLTLFLIEHLHPSLRPASDQLEYCVLRMRYACETLMSRHGVQVASAYTELHRLAEAATEILVMTAVLARASRSYCIGLRAAEVEMKLASCFVDATKTKVRNLIKEIDEGEYLNLDHFKVQFGKKILDANTSLTEKPTARTFW